MSRNLSANTSASGGPNFNRKVEIYAPSGVEFEVPSGVTDLYVTGTAAGGLNGGGYTAIQNWPSITGNYAVAASDNGAVVVVTPTAGLIGNVSPAIWDVVSNRIHSMQMFDQTLRTFYPLDNGFVFAVASGQTSLLDKSFRKYDLSCSYFDNVASSMYFAVKPVPMNAGISDIKAIGRGAGTPSSLLVFTGGKIEFTLISLGANVSIESVHHIDNKFVVFCQGGTTAKTHYYWIDDDADYTVLANWKKVTVAQITTNLVVPSVACGGGKYCFAVPGKTYTSTDISGPWVETLVSDISNALFTVKHGGGKFLICILRNAPDYVTALTSVDGGLWIKSTIYSSSSAVLNRSIIYDYITAAWYWCDSSYPRSARKSTDGVTWVDASFTSCSLAKTPLGIVSANNSYSGFYREWAGLKAMPTYFGDGGDLSITRVTDMSTLLRLVGGGVATTSTGGVGGSSTYAMPGGTATSSALGIGGNGGTPTVSASGLGGPGGANAYGGGGTPLLMNIASDQSAWGVKIAGAGGGGWAASGKSGGGGSIFAPGANAGTRAIGYGCGAGSSSYAAGGGGEAIVRYRIPVSPGEKLVISTGGAGVFASQGQTQYAGAGIAILEWEG